MEFNFRLNDRDSNQLSDRIINGSEALFRQLLGDGFVQKFMVCGEKNERNITIAYNRFKDAQDYASDQFLKQALKNCNRLTDKVEEQQFFGMCIDGFAKAYAGYEESFIKGLGRAPAHIMAEPPSQPNYGYGNHFLFNTSEGPILRALVTILPGFLVPYRVTEYVKQHPDFKPNPFFKHLGYEEFGLNVASDQIRAMIDSRGDGVSEQEVEDLIVLLQRGVAYERDIENHRYEGKARYEA